MRRDAEQLQIEVTPAPHAVGCWDVDHEIAAYRNTMGDEAFARQRRLAERAKECTCGKQDEADAAATKEGQRLKKILGWEHKPGCNSFAQQHPKLAPRITGAEQQARYEDGQRVNQLRDALAKTRGEDS